MGFRFRKSISILPGVRLNISKGGISTSIGRPGATINIGKRGVRGTVGLPGSGLSYSDMLVSRRSSERVKLGSDHEIVQDEEEARRPLGGERAEGAEARKTKLILVIVAVVVLSALIVLFGAGLMSARQQSPGAGFQPSANPEIPNKSPVVGSMAADDQLVRVARSVNCRANPNGRAAVTTVLSGEEALTVVDRQAGWTRVTTDEQDCWVDSALVR